MFCIDFRVALRTFFFYIWRKTIKMVETLEKKYTIEEYFELERSSDIRHEYIDGKLIPMSGESKIANKIAYLLGVFLFPIITKKALEVYSHSVKVRLSDGRRYRYPDFMVAPVADDEFSHLVTQPILIMEVLSNSTANVDKTNKLREYRELETLQHYLIVDQDEKYVEMYSKTGDKWLFEMFDENNKIIELSALETKISLDDLYNGIY